MFPWFSFLTYIIITAVTPGPNTLMSLSCGVRYGIKKSLPFELGIGVGFALASLLCMVFCSLLSATIPQIQFPMKVLGVAYMLYLAWKTFSSSPDVEGKNVDYTFFSGMILQFLNPKLYMYCIVSMKTYILPYYRGQWATLTGFALLLALCGFVFSFCWAAFGSAFKAFFSRCGKLANTIFALLLFYCAVSLFL